VLVGSGNPEEGELRPQLLDRFGLSVEVRTPQDLALRVQVIKRRDAFERDPAGFRAEWEAANQKLRKNILKARSALERLEVGDDLLHQCAALCQKLGTDGLRAELTCCAPPAPWRPCAAQKSHPGPPARNCAHGAAPPPAAQPAGRHRLQRAGAARHERGARHRPSGCSAHRHRRAGLTPAEAPPIRYPARLAPPHDPSA